MRLALYTPEPNEDGVRVFTIIRGAEGAVASAGGLALPPSARLRVQTSWATRVAKYDQLMALNVSGTSGIVAMWILFVYDSNMGLTYLEGCQRAWLDGRLVQIGDGEDVSPGGDCTRKSAKPLFSFFVASSGAAFSRHFYPLPPLAPLPRSFLTAATTSMRAHMFSRKQDCWKRARAAHWPTEFLTPTLLCGSKAQTLRGATRKPTRNALTRGTTPPQTLRTGLRPHLFFGTTLSSPP